MTEEHPRQAMAKQLWGPVADQHRLGAGHARSNLEYALTVAVMPPGETGYGTKRHAVILESNVDYLIKPQYRAGILAELRSIRDSVLAKYPWETEGSDNDAAAE